MVWEQSGIPGIRTGKLNLYSCHHTLTFCKGGTRDLGFHLYVQGKGDFGTELSVEEMIKDAKSAEFQEVSAYLFSKLGFFNHPSLQNPKVYQTIEKHRPHPYSGSPRNGELGAR
jgi:hypothetical protein